MKGLQEHTARLKGRNEEMTEKRRQARYMKFTRVNKAKEGQLRNREWKKKIDVKSLHVSLLAANLS